MLWKNLQLKPLYQRSDDNTSFKPFAEYFSFLLTVSGFNVLRKDFLLSKWDRFVTGIIFSLPVVAVFVSFHVIWKYSEDLEEIVLGLITLIMCFQIVSKLAELFFHRNDHCEMVMTVIKQTQELKNNREFQEIGNMNFRRAQFYVSTSTVIYFAAWASLNVYPLLALIIQKQFKLCVNMEIPWTNHKEPIGFTLNYIFALVVSSLGCLIILGKDFK